MSFLSLSRWRPVHLFVAWMIYWIALVAVAVGPAVPAMIRATTPNAKGQISAAVGDEGLSLIVKQSGVTTWSGSVHLLTAALWLAVPPLILWLIWTATRRAPTREVLGAGR
jgi:hypothetical protein